MRKGTLLAIIFGIVLPWLLSFIFLTLLTDIDWTMMTEGAAQYFAILSFASIAFVYSVPIFGYGFLIPLFIWVITGLFCGLFCKEVKKGIGITLLGLFLNIIIMVLLTTINPSFIPGSFICAENVGLLGGISLDFFITLGLLLFWYSFTVPGSILGGMIGGIISRNPIVE